MVSLKVNEPAEEPGVMVWLLPNIFHVVPLLLGQNKTVSQTLTISDVAVRQTGLPNYTVLAFNMMSVKPAGGSMFLVMSLLTDRLVADVIVGCFVDSRLSVSVLV